MATKPRKAGDDAGSVALSQLRAEMESAGFRRSACRAPWWSYSLDLEGGGWTVVVVKLDDFDITVAGDRPGHRRGCALRRRLKPYLDRLREVNG